MLIIGEIGTCSKVWTAGTLPYRRDDEFDDVSVRLSVTIPSPGCATLSHIKEHRPKISEFLRGKCHFKRGKGEDLGKDWISR